MFEREKPKRDEMGWWIHSKLDTDEMTDRPVSDHPDAQDMEIDFFYYDEELRNPDGPTDISAWNPDPPDGAGWFPIGYGENEDGPFAAFARPAGGKGLELPPEFVKEAA